MVFISYSSVDEEIAKKLYNSLNKLNIKKFMAKESLEPGDKWNQKILKKLEASDWIFYLASENSIKSPTVQQELGVALIQDKIIIPLLINLNPEQLPIWISQFQAISYEDEPDKLEQAIEKISKKISRDKLITGGLILGALYLLSK